MIICHCFRVSSTKLIELMKNCATLDELYEKTYAGQGCGSCVAAIEELFLQVKEERENENILQGQ